MKTISAYKARTNFGELLNEVYYKDEEIVIERKGKPMVKMVPAGDFPKTKKGKMKDPFLEAAGMWKDIDAEKMIAEIYKARRDGSRKKKFLANW